MLSIVNPCHDLFAPTLLHPHDLLLAHLARGPAPPRLHVSETDAGYSLEANVPGAKPSDVKVSVDGRDLTISAEMRADGLSRRFSHRLALPDDADPDKATVSCEHGILRIEVPMAEAEEFDIGLVDPDALPAEDEQGQYRQSVNAPGVAPADLNVKCSRGHMEIEGRTEARGAVYGIRRRFSLPHDADKAGVTAALAHGILTLVVPKLPSPEPRQLPVADGADTDTAADPAAATPAAEDFHMC